MRSLPTLAWFVIALAWVVFVLGALTALAAGAYGGYDWRAPLAFLAAFAWALALAVTGRRLFTRWP